MKQNFLLRLKYKILYFVYRILFRYVREEPSCLSCIYWSKCPDYVEKGRKYLEQGENDFFYKIAGMCDDWQMDINIRLDREAARSVRGYYEAILRDVFDSAEMGKVAVLQKDGVGQNGNSSTRLFGTFNDDVAAQKAIEESRNGHRIVILNAKNKE